MEEKTVHNSLDFLKNLEKYTLESKLLTCQTYSKRIITSSKVDLDKALNENIMPWELEAFAAYSIIYDNDESTEKLDAETFANTITLIRNYWHSGLTEAEKSGYYPETFMMISASQQFPVQGLFLQKLFRYHYFFTFQNDKLNMGKVLYDKMGVSYGQLEEFAFLVILGFSEDTKIESFDRRKILECAFSDKDVLRLLTIEKEDYKKDLYSLYQDNVIDQYYGLKIQYLYPFIEYKDFVYVPSPYLVINAVTDSMLNRLTENDNKLRSAIGKNVIEHYLFDIIGQISSLTWISQEMNYKKGKAKYLTSDVIAAENDKVIFYDTKAISPSLKLRKFDIAEIEHNIEIYASNVIQIYTQIINYLDGLYKLDKF